MRLNLLKIFLFSLIITVLIVPNAIAVAVTCPPSAPCPPKAVCIPNPLCATTFGGLIDAIINFLFTIALAIAPLMIIIAGFYFITAAGDPAKITTAKQIILWTSIGLLIVICAKGIIALFEKVFTP